ncbi:MAG: hypothetical protein GF398_15635 [Chitinivibrionales bacterium]|nr:hypothetical protein [Chitinivibrionales bacterium]
MRAAVIFFLIVFVLIWGSRSCAPRYRSARNTTQNTTVNATAEAADGLDLKALNALIPEAKSAKELEQELNKPGGINNLDLNADGQVDFIKVTEFGNQEDGYGFSLTTEPVKGEEQEIASIEIVKTGEKAQVQVHGNEQIYGRGHHYHSTHSLGSLMLWSYFLMPHPFYVSPWYYGYYPGYYSPYRTVTRTVYRNRARSVTGSRSINRSSNRAALARPKSNLNNPNTGKVASQGIKKSLRNPTSTQKQFAARSASRSTRSGGFGRGSGRGRSRTGSRSSSRSARGFGGSRSYGGFGK